MNKSTIYCRVSNKNSFSIDNQKDKCIKYCKDRKIKVNEMRVHNGTARGGENSKSIENIINSMQEGDVLVVPSICRFSRNVTVGLSLFDRLMSKGAHLHAVDEDMVFTGGNVYKRTTFIHLLNLAEAESNIISKRVNGSKKRKRSSVSYGYEYITVGDETVMQKVPLEQSTISEIKRRRGDGESRKSVCDDLNKRNILFRGRKWTPDRITRITRKR